jgi:hypothetical protein
MLESGSCNEKPFGKLTAKTGLQESLQFIRMYPVDRGSTYLLTLPLPELWLLELCSQNGPLSIYSAGHSRRYI